jgi:hypothetical protein
MLWSYLNKISQNHAFFHSLVRLVQIIVLLVPESHDLKIQEILIWLNGPFKGRWQRKMRGVGKKTGVQL